MTDTTPRVEQRHREAADSWMNEWRLCLDQDDYSGLVQAFAQFEADHLAQHSQPGQSGGEVEQSLAHQIAFYNGPSVSFEVSEGFYLASCDTCGWVGSSEHCGTDSFGDDSDVFCPRCMSSGADCGKVAERLDAPSTERERRLEEALRPFADAWDVATHHKDLVAKLTMAQLGELAAHELTGVHYRNASQALGEAK